ncbi:MAG TPA: hypothetical protein DEF79_03540 [Gammaproteobacteria bacterium]|nr:hypothetical protein [Gammaproteobacteria bacterium]
MLQGILLPFSRQQECSKCRAGLHPCLAGRRYDPEAADAYLKSRTGFTPDKKTVNICGFFIGGIKAHKRRFSATARKPRAELAEIFGKKLQTDAVNPSQTTQTRPNQALAEIKRLLGES